jgi:hypothetical protein
MRYSRNKPVKTLSPLVGPFLRGDYAPQPQRDQRQIKKILARMTKPVTTKTRVASDWAIRDGDE